MDKKAIHYRRGENPVKQLNGIAASPGIAIAKVYQLDTLDFSFDKTLNSTREQEINRLNSALQASKQEIKAMKEQTIHALGQEAIAIFDVHLLILNDAELINPIKDKIKNDGWKAEAAMVEVMAGFIRSFENIDNDYMKERADDIRDVLKRVLAHLLHVSIPNTAKLTEEMILIAPDLTPSETAQLNQKFIKGIVTDAGGNTSHSSIIARSLEIPAVVGTKNITKTVQSGDIIIIDGFKGVVILHPDERTVTAYQEQAEQFAKEKQSRKKSIEEEIRTKDGKRIELAANISSPEDLKRALHVGARTIGLYRTEFLYMGKPTLPSEKEQFEVYASALKQMNENPVIIRTLDIGGDKRLNSFTLPEEMNPSLGLHSIRFCLRHEEIFRPQLRALLRASIYGNLKIMFPMITTLEEFREAKALLLEEKAALENEGFSLSDSIQIGVMIEVPSAAILASQLAKEVDFFSIGTNDLIQYTLATDRLNEQVASLYQPYHPAILHLIHHVIQAGEKEGIRVAVCGEMAADAIGIPILLALGLSEFSMDPASLLKVQAQLKNLSDKELTTIKDDLLHLGTADEVVAMIKKWID